MKKLNVDPLLPGGDDLVVQLIGNKASEADKRQEILHLCEQIMRRVDALEPRLPRRQLAIGHLCEVCKVVGMQVTTVQALVERLDDVLPPGPSNVLTSSEGD